MSAEINPKHPGTTLPNPHAAENKLLLGTGALLVLMGLGALLFTRLEFGLDLSRGSKLTLAILSATLLLLAGCRLLALAFKQLRFIFVMESLAPLADLLDKDEQIKTMSADNLRARLRNNQPLLLEPRGAIDGLLFRLIPAMSQTPAPLVRIATIQFFNGLVLGATLLSFSLALIGSEATSRSWMGLAYFVFGAFVLMRTILRGANQTAPFNEKRMIGLLVAAAILPPMLAMMLTVPAPGASHIAYGLQAVLLMATGLAGSTLFVLALRGLTQAPPITDIANAQRSLTIHTTPNQIFNELEREMMSLWVNRMPNRRYLELAPSVTGRKGSFTGELIEETMPHAEDVAEMSLTEALSQQSYRWVATLGIYGCALTLVGGGLLLASFLVSDPSFNALIAGIALLGVGVFCILGANQLWRRFEFRSRIYWIEARGEYQTARADFGAQLHGEVRTSRESTFVEAMTLRVWCADLSSVSYNLKQARFLTHISGHREEAERLLSHLSAQVAVLGGDAVKVIEHVTAMKLARTQHELTQQLANPDAKVSISAPATYQPVCPGCQHHNTQAAKFCGQCGNSLLLGPVDI